MVFRMKHAIPLLAILPLACAPTASAAPDTPAKPANPGHGAADKPADACKPSGKVVFEIDHRVEPGAKLATAEVKLYPTGAWTRDAADADGKAEPQTTGCIARADYKQIADALRAAPWKVTTARVHCMAMSSTFTEFQVDGKKVFTQKLCSGHTLDDKSRAALERAVAQLEPPASQPAKP
jgi:hypothetical protein